MTAASDGVSGAGEFVVRTATVDGAGFPYQVFVPAAHGAAGAGATPTILFLHGAGERGADGKRQMTVGLGPLVARRAAEFPAMVVFPQAPRPGDWSGSILRAASVALTEASSEFGGDPERTYLTGISMGGYGAWDLALDEPERFAALVPVCGGLRPSASLRKFGPAAVALRSATMHARAAATLAHIPTWVFHGDADPIIPVEESREMVEAMRGAGANVQYTEYPGVGHNSWDPAYAEAGLWEWMFAQRRR